MADPAYCASRFRAVRRPTREVVVGGVGVGGPNPIRLQSMTTSDTEDVAATLAQCVKLAEAGCEIIRITAPNKAAAAALRTASRKLDKAASKGVIHKNQAANRKSGIAARVKALLG